MFDHDSTDPEVKESSNSSDVKRNKELLESKTPLDVGGMEGKKYRMWLIVEGARVPYIAKVYNPVTLGRKRIYDDLGTIRALKEMGYNVPQESFCIDDGDIMYLCMSDITEEGKYLLWGRSNDMTEAQKNQLTEMEITPEDLQKISSTALELAEKATRDGLSLTEDYYHLRKNTETGEFDLYLLDVNCAITDNQSYFSRVEPNRTIAKENPLWAESFIRRIEYHSGVYRPGRQKEELKIQPEERIFILD